MMPARVDPPLIEQLPSVRGELTANAPLHKYAWFRVGGPAEVLFQPADREDLSNFLAGMPPAVPVTVIGVASNLLIRDGGVSGVVIRLGRPFAEISIDDNRVRAGAGATDIEVARTCRDAGLAGLEFLSGVPGTVGGALRMNAGAYGKEISDVIVEAEVLDPRGGCRRVAPADLGYSYRHCSLDPAWIFVAGTFAGEPDAPADIARRMEEISKAREESQPIRTRTGGSTFKNPDGHRAWELVDKAGCRGLQIGGARVSDLHCNFLINTGDATAADIENLGEEVRRRVRENAGVELEWEIRRIGVSAPGGQG